MNIIITIKLALTNINSYKMRSALTMLGLVIGIASVIMLVGIGKGATDSVYGSMAGLGAELISVEIYDTNSSIPYGNINDFEEISGTAGIAPAKSIQANVNRGTKKLKWSRLTGTNEKYADLMGFTIGSGRDLSDIDIENNSKVAVIGSSIAQKLFGAENPLDKAINIGGNRYTVVGLLSSGGDVTGQADNMILIPITTAKYLGESATIQSVYVKAASKDQVSAVSEDIKKYLNENYDIDEDSYNVYTNAGALKSINQMSTYLSMLLGGIASISLIVGGIGIMNVMYVSVSERTKEIGIRKSLGATKHDILKQFLIESLVLSLIGGIIGIVFGVGCGAGINVISNGLYSISIFKPTVSIAVLSFSVSASIGLIFGIFPSYRAACMRPIDALKQE